MSPKGQCSASPLAGAHYLCSHSSIHCTNFKTFTYFEILGNPWQRISNEVSNRGDNLRRTALFASAIEEFQLSSFKTWLQGILFPFLHARLPAGCVHTPTSFSLLYSSPFIIRCLQIQGLLENTYTDFTLRSYLCVLYSSFALDFDNCQTLQLILKIEPDVLFPTSFVGVHFSWSMAPFGHLHNVWLGPTDLAAT